MSNNGATAEQITFYSYWLPALKPGEYVVKVKPTLTADGKALTDESPDDEKDAVTETFHVGAPRWALTGSEVYSCYPAPGQIGEFSNTLPHIVFDRCTLPWERTIDGKDQTDPPVPWLALILLTDADFSSETAVDKKQVPQIKTRKLNELLKATEGGVIVPEDGVIVPESLKPDPYDDKDKVLCQTIDLPARLFSAVMPQKDALQYLAHVREVKTGNKETWSLLKEGKFSVVICNRFPETQPKASNVKDWGIVNTVCLVSLEGWDKHLKNPAELDKPQFKAKSCRFVVLGSWRFTCQGSGTFKTLMENLNKVPKPNTRPQEYEEDNRLLSRGPLSGNDGPAVKYINDAFAMGFTPVNHDLRNDDSTISWYRGALAPMEYTKSSYTDILCADAALRYNSNTGMFDASYAAAWQLGRLLALQDQAFAQALFGFRTAYQRWVRRTNTEALGKMADLQRDLGGNLNPRDWYTKTLTDASYLNGNPPKQDPAKKKPPDKPLTVQNWLGQAMLLYGVPFQYLVPDKEMLPAESIRFFYLNPDWLNCLLQGACSVGRTSATDELADQLLRAEFFEVSEELASKLRSSAKEAADARRVGSEAKEQEAPKLQWPLSGYLLRSEAVEAWIGLEATAKGVNSAGKLLDPLQILRMDRLAPDILLCIYNGKVTKIEVKQPPEAVHFGAASITGGVYQKGKLRRIIKGGHGEEPGDWLGDSNVPVLISPNRVVQVKQLAEKIREKLAALNQMAGGDPVTSAEFAVEMIESPAKVKFEGPK
jgi:hypothetical protein